jgi:hypothetical protein
MAVFGHDVVVVSDLMVLFAGTVVMGCEVRLMMIAGV